MLEERTTPEKIYLSRREILKRTGLMLAGALVSSACGRSQPTADLPSTPAPTLAPTREPGDYTGVTDEFDDPLTPLAKLRKHGNYYEFTRANEGISEAARSLKTSPWQVEVGGLVRNPGVYNLEDLDQFGPEERIYRLRCIEAWSMVLPWTGFPLHRLLQAAEPTAEAAWARFDALYDPQQLPGQNPGQFDEWLRSDAANRPEGFGGMGGAEDSPYIWPYSETLRLDEALHDLTLLATGVYGKPLPPENGAPLRLVVPWKYAFKSIKAVVRIELVAERPATFWNTVLPNEYGFWANVNPDVPHPRWSQGREYRLLGQDPEPILPTLPFNGYATQVAHLYEGMDLTVNF